MVDEVKEPVNPAAAASYSAARNVGIIISGVATIWTLFSKGGLTDAYVWLNSVQGAPFVSTVTLVVLAAWGPAKKYLDKKLIKQQHEAIKIAVATAPEAAPVIQAVAKGEVK